MTMILWVVIAVVVLLSILLVYMEHEWGVLLGGATAVTLLISYFAAGLVLRSPLIVLLPQGAHSQFDAMALIAATLLVVTLILIAYLAGRRSAAKEKR
jgi:hypothetical protein